ncbi:hypothetical protein [Vibrio salinus]|uniref:hypothetical protein n=1 Tax=Vibrio salinus TaxID=2899784 RepID=UPI001E3321AD|nr:hypothetical protein [Vibrio salinus]MCE0495505.1 hypothetical protein [Vibrio salinus]
MNEYVIGLFVLLLIQAYLMDRYTKSQRKINERFEAQIKALEKRLNDSVEN